MTYKTIETRTIVDQLGHAVDTSSLRFTGNETGRHLARVNLKGFSGLFDPTGSRITPQVVITNSYRGECAFTLNVGFLRQVCSNGMVAGLSFFGTRIIHREGQTADQKIAAIREGVEHAADHINQHLMPKLEDLHAQDLTPDQMFAVAQALPLTRRDRDSLLRALTWRKRSEDEENTIYTLWNLANEAQLGMHRPGGMAAELRNLKLLEDIECLAQNVEAA